MRRFLALAVMACPVGAFAQLLPTMADVEYARINGRPLLLDLYMPVDAPSAAPVVVWIHGGGWVGGDKFPIGGMQQRLLDRGIAVASVNYRLTSEEGEWGGAPVVWPAQIHDVKAAVRFLRASAPQLGLDRCAVGAWGSSAGGHLAAMMAVSSGVGHLEGGVGLHTAWGSAVLVAADYYGPSDLLAMNGDVTNPPGSIIDHDVWFSPESRLVGWDEPGQGIGDIRNNIGNPAAPYPQLVALTRSASPALLVDAGDAPLFIGHGAQDTSVPTLQSVRIADAYAAASVPFEILIDPDAGHGGLDSSIADAAVEFLAARLEGACPCPADLNYDAQVGFTDLNLLLSSFGSGSGGDADGDGDTDFSDLNALLSAFGSPCARF